MTNENRVADLVVEVGALVGDDGTGDNGIIIREALRDDPGVTAAQIAEIIRESRQDAALDREVALGDRVEGGGPGTEDHDTGRVVRVDGDQVTVAWSNGETTTQRASALRPEGA